MGASLSTASGWSWGSEVGARASRRQDFGSRSHSNQWVSFGFSVEVWGGTLKASLYPRLSSNFQKEFDSLSREKDPEMYLAGMLVFGERLEEAGKLELAGEVYGALVDAPVARGFSPAGSEPITKARHRLDALMGRGHSGLRAEFLLKRFTDTATDYRTIVPMIAGSMVYQFTRTTALGRLAATPWLGWASRGWRLQLTSAAAGLGAESTVFLGVHHGLLSLSGETSSSGSIGQNWLGTTLTLGAMKLASAGGSILPQTKWSGLLQGGASFGGLLAAHRLEIALGLRPHLDGATTLTDTLGTYLALSVGGNLGHRILGPSLSRLPMELGLRLSNPRSGENSPFATLFQSLSPRPQAVSAGLAVPVRTPKLLGPQGPDISPLKMSSMDDGPKGPGDTPFPKNFIQNLSAQALQGQPEAFVRLGELAREDIDALSQLVELGMKYNQSGAKKILETIDLSYYSRNAPKVFIGWLTQFYSPLSRGNPSAVELYFTLATQRGVKEHVKIMALRQMLKIIRQEPQFFNRLMDRFPAETLPERVMHPDDSEAPVLLALYAERGHSEALLAMVEGKNHNPWAERFLDELRPELQEQAKALEDEPLIRVVASAEGSESENYRETKRKNTVRELYQKAKEGDFEALGLLVLMAKQNLAPGWALFELATTVKSDLAREKIVSLDLSNLVKHLPNHEETRHLFFALGKAGHPQAPEMLLEAAVAHGAERPWAVTILKDFADRGEPRALSTLRNLETRHYLEAARGGVGDAAAILRLLVEHKNANALVSLWEAAGHHPVAQRQLEFLAQTDPASLGELGRLFPENEELRIFLAQVMPGAGAKSIAPVSSGSDVTGTSSAGTTLPPDLLQPLPRGGVMVRTSSGWIQLGVPRWTNKDAFERFAAQGGFQKGKEEVPNLIPTVYFFDPAYVPETDGLLPADFIQYMYFVSKGTTFTMVAPDGKTAERLQAFLDVSYLGLQDPQITERVRREYLFDPYGPPDLGEETRRGFPGPDKETMRRVAHLDEHGEFRLGSAVVRKLEPLVYEIQEGEKLLGTVDLRDFPVPQPTLLRNPKFVLDPELQKIRHGVLVERRPALWPIGTGHGFTPHEETSGFMIWNQGKAVIVDPPSITLEYLTSVGIPLDKIDGILLTHGHTDHHGPAVPQLLRMLPRVKLYTSPEIKRMLQKQYELAIGNHGEGLEQWNFVPLYQQYFTDIVGLHFRAEYGFHPISALGFEIYDRPDIKNGKLVLSFTGDTFADYEGIWKHTRPGPNGEPPLMSEERALSVTRHMALLLASKWQKPPPVFLIEGGIPPIHIDPNKTRKFLDFASRLGVDVSRVRVYHIAEKAAADAGVAKWQAGHPGAFDLSDYFADFKPRNFPDFVLEKIGEQPLLAKLPEEVRRTLLQQGILERVEAGTVLIREGEMDDRVLLLIDGEMEITKKEKKIAQRPSGLVGEGTLLGERRNATVTATVPSVILHWQGKEMKKLLESTGLIEDLEHIRTVRAEAYDGVAKSPLGRLPDFILDQLFRIGVVKYFRPNSVVLHQGDQSRDVFVTLQGDVRIRNREKTIHVIRPEGTMLGEMALVNNAPRSAEVVALDPLKVLWLPASALEKLMEEYPGIGIALKRTAEARREENVRKVQDNE